MGLFSSEPSNYQVKDRDLICHNCRNDLFWSREAQLNTAVASFFSLDWANKTATCLVCSECAYIHWFLV